MNQIFFGGVSLKQVEKFKYLKVAFTSYGKQEELMFNQAKQVLPC